MALPIRGYDKEALRDQFRAANPFPFIAIDGFLEEDFAREVAAAYPNFEDARRMGDEFSAVNEKLKVQVTDMEIFPAPVARLSEAIAAPEFLADLEYITGIPRLLADPALRGGGMHLTNTSGRLDVHVDFNYIEEEALHRRLNILIYLNPEWSPDWGGSIELWDSRVEHCGQSFLPALNRCVIFETSATSFHGVTAVTSPPEVLRRSFAAYYYTREAPAEWSGESHSTVFKARPDEWFRGAVVMPMERLVHRARSLRGKLRDSLRARP
jgi:hypothetical protein